MVDGTLLIPEIFYRLAELRASALSATTEWDRENKSKELLTGLLFFAQEFMGDSLLAAAHGRPGSDDPEDILRSVAARALGMSMLFATLPEDGASLGRVAEEAMAVASGDTPVIFARLPNTRKRAHRVTHARFSALTWDAYLDGLSIPSHERHAAISSAFGHDWDTVSRWIKPACASFGDEYVAYHLAYARNEGVARKPYSLGQTYSERKTTVLDGWPDRLRAAGRQFFRAQRENLNASA